MNKAASNGRTLLGVRHEGGGFYASPGRANQVAVTIHRWDVATGQALPARHLTATGPGTEWAGYSCFSADGRLIAIPGGLVCDLGGRTSLAELAAVLAGADAVLVANTGVAHLSAAVGTPVVSLFAPVVPAARWAPYGVPVTLLGDQHAPCRDSRAVRCPVPGHPCLTGVSAEAACRALDELRTREAA